MLLIYLPVITPRSEYIFDAIFKNEFGIEYRTTSNKFQFENYKFEKINYSGQRFNDEFFIKASSLLAEDSIKKFDIPVGIIDQTKVLFPNIASCDLGFDVFSAAFYMVSRYEEYLPFQPDKFGRFEAKDSLAYKNEFLQIPVVDKWINLLRNALKARFPSLEIIKPQFKAIVTYDIDVAYKYKGRSFKRNIGATIKDLLKLDLKNIQSRIQTFNSKHNDPWDTYSYLEDRIVKNNLSSIFFFLLAENSKHDRNLDFENPVMKKLVGQIKSFSEPAIHPSFKSSSEIKKISEEKERLENIAGEKITKSRQHYLKFILPETFNALKDIGISEDYSMGFPYHPGFRAGTSKPFYFYDLKNEKTTQLKIFPVTFMEGNFMHDKNLRPEKALVSILNLIREVRSVNGTFISIWHNHTVSETPEFEKWRIVHDQMIRTL